MYSFVRYKRRQNPLTKHSEHEQRRQSSYLNYFTNLKNVCLPTITHPSDTNSYKMSNAYWTHGSALILEDSTNWKLVRGPTGATITPSVGNLTGTVYLPVQAIGGKTASAVEIDMTTGTKATMTEVAVYCGATQLYDDSSLSVTGAGTHTYNINKGKVPSDCGLVICITFSFVDATSDATVQLFGAGITY